MFLHGFIIFVVFSMCVTDEVIFDPVSIKNSVSGGVPCDVYSRGVGGSASVVADAWSRSGVWRTWEGWGCGRLL